MPMQITVTDQASALLAALGARLEHPQPIYEAAALAIVALTQRAFVEPGVRAAPWAPLAPATLRGRRAATYKTALLRRSGLLFRSWRTAATDAEGAVVTDRPYAAFHQFGTARGLSARPMLPILGAATQATLTPLAAQSMLEAAQAALSALLSPPAG